MDYVSEEFIKQFNKIENAHSALKNKVNSFRESGEELDSKLEIELDNFLS